MEQNSSAHRKVGTKQSTRFETLNALRGVTVILAMLNHFKVQFVKDVHVLVPLTRPSTPGFIILFGAIIEISYLSKLRAGRSMRSVRERMASLLITLGNRCLTVLSCACIGQSRLRFSMARSSWIGAGSV